MKYLAILLAVAGFAAAKSISIDDYFPECSTKCLRQGLADASDCKESDGVCICIFDNYAAIVDSATSCVIQACGNSVAVGKWLFFLFFSKSYPTPSISQPPNQTPRAGGLELIPRRLQRRFSPPRTPTAPP